MRSRPTALTQSGETLELAGVVLGTATPTAEASWRAKPSTSDARKGRPMISHRARVGWHRFQPRTGGFKFEDAPAAKSRPVKKNLVCSAHARAHH